MWLVQQVAAVQALKTLHSPNGKRVREDEAENEHTTKKCRISPVEEIEDKPVYTLYALSVATLLRKKLDILVRQHSLRLVNPAIKAVESSLSMFTLKRAFLLPTRGKTKPH